MNFIVTLSSLALIFLILVDSFETTVLPRRVTRRFRFARLYYVTSWKLWRGLSLCLPTSSWRESFLGAFGPLSLLGLLANWVVGLIVAFAMLNWSLGTALHAPDHLPTFGTYLYWSGGTFFTLGYGDITPTTALGRFLAVVEAGMGFGFLAMIIGYLPGISQTFSRREVLIALLDARAGSPPSAGQLLVRQAQAGSLSGLDPFLVEWERWAAELLESHLSFPVLSYYRSQHENQSWLAALTAILDTCAFMIVSIKDASPYQAQLTLAMARHVAVDLALVFRVPPILSGPDRLTQDQLAALRRQLREAGLPFLEGPAVDAKLTELRGMYEPFLLALSQRFQFAMPPFVADKPGADNWQRSAWLKRAPELGSLPLAATGDEHFA